MKGLRRSAEPVGSSHQPPDMDSYLSSCRASCDSPFSLFGSVLTGLYLLGDLDGDGVYFVGGLWWYPIIGRAPACIDLLYHRETLGDLAKDAIGVAEPLLAGGPGHYEELAPIAMWLACVRHSDGAEMVRACRRVLVSKTVTRGAKVVVGRTAALNNKARNDSEERSPVKEMVERQNVEVIRRLRSQVWLELHVEGSSGRVDDRKIVIVRVETLRRVLLEVSFVRYHLGRVGAPVWQQVAAGFGGRRGYLV